MGKSVMTTAVVSMFEIKIVAVHEVPEHWNGFSRILDACPQSWNEWYRKERILEDLLKGNLQLWLVLEKGTVAFSAITQVVSTDVGKIVQVVWGFGRMSNEIKILLHASCQRFA